MMPQAEPWVSVDGIAAHLTVSKDTVYRWIAEWDTPSAQVGGRWKFRITKVDAWVESGQAADREVQGDEAEGSDHAN
jgi:excisionase family DNA binding protein